MRHTRQLESRRRQQGPWVALTGSSNWFRWRQNSAVDSVLERLRPRQRDEANLCELGHPEAVEQCDLQADDDDDKVWRQIPNAVERGQDDPERPCQTHPPAKMREHCVPHHGST
eukprot:3939797-Rhodomonas_salina.6